ncbi:hypothetical protein BZG36_04086 [Bifiguratus adelaidae]|uniref:Zn(2)-C6 fungal-type domain-containing protein n=1 Tax=Bifiguratus adelaidae TaxID=1938954 RepID=A0A261XWW3_9FUNG|nr:hypothetical protein BZG36_04086 [Bifiguratus adelaidae]
MDDRKVDRREMEAAIFGESDEELLLSEVEDLEEDQGVSFSAPKADKGSEKAARYGDDKPRPSERKARPVDDDEKRSRKKPQKVRSHKSATVVEEEEEGPKEPLNPKQLEMQEIDALIEESLKSGKKKRRKVADEYDLDASQDEMMATMVKNMREAAEKDIDANSEKKAAVNKIRMLKEIVREMNKTSLHEGFLDNGILDSMRMWLEPLPDGSLPALDLQTEIMTILEKLPIRTEHLRESHIGKIIHFYTKSERVDARVKRMADTLVGQWSRPIINRSQDYREKKRARAVYYADDELGTPPPLIPPEESMAESLDKKPKKRAKVPQACERCRRLKRKCDAQYPVCRRCQYSNDECVYANLMASATDAEVQAKITNLENTVRELSMKLSKLSDAGIEVEDILGGELKHLNLQTRPGEEERGTITPKTNETQTSSLLSHDSSTTLTSFSSQPAPKPAYTTHHGRQLDTADSPSSETTSDSSTDSLTGAGMDALDAIMKLSAAHHMQAPHGNDGVIVTTTGAGPVLFSGDAVSYMQSFERNARDRTTIPSDALVSKFGHTHEETIDGGEPYFTILSKERRLSIVTNITGLNLLKTLCFGDGAVNPFAMAEQGVLQHLKSPLSDPSFDIALIPHQNDHFTKAIQHFHMNGTIGDQQGRLRIRPNPSCLLYNTLSLQRALVKAYCDCPAPRLQIWHPVFFPRLVGGSPFDGTAGASASTKPHPITSGMCAIMLSVFCRHTEFVPLTMDERFDLSEAFFQITRDAIEGCLDDEPDLEAVLCLVVGSSYHYFHHGPKRTIIYTGMAMRLIDHLLRREAQDEDDLELSMKAERVECDGSAKVWYSAEERHYRREVLKRCLFKLILDESNMSDWFGTPQMDLSGVGPGIGAALSAHATAESVPDPYERQLSPASSTSSASSPPPRRPSHAQMTGAGVFYSGRLEEVEGEEASVWEFSRYVNCCAARHVQVMLPLRALYDKHGLVTFGLSTDRKPPVYPISRSQIRGLEKRLDEWYASLPSEYQFRDPTGRILPVDIFSVSDEGCDVGHAMLTEEEIANINGIFTRYHAKQTRPTPQVKSVPPSNEASDPLFTYAHAVSLLLSYYYLALRLHMQFLTKQEGGKLSRSDVVCTRGAVVVTLLMEGVLAVPTCSVDFDIVFEAADIHIHNCTVATHPPLMAQSVQHLIRWLQAAKLKQRAYRPVTAPLYRWLDEIEGRVVGLCGY